MFATLKIIIVFIGMLVLNRIKVPLSFALMIGGIGLNIWCGKSLEEAMKVFAGSFLRLDFWLLVIITIFVLEIGRFLTEKENSDSLLRAALRWGGKHGVVMSLVLPPALVGLIPMPAGALCSAPMIGQATDNSRWSASIKASVNYWFRHLWEYWWPLYAGVIVAMTQFDMPPSLFFVTQIPFTIVAFLSGYMFIIKPHLQEFSKRIQSDNASEVVAVREILFPIGLIIVATIVFSSFLQVLFPKITVLSGENQRMIGILAGLGTGIIAIVCADYRRAGKLLIFRNMLSKKSIAVILVIMGVKIFQHQLESSAAVIKASEEMAMSNMRVEYIIAFLPFLAGVVTGVAVGFTGISFPLVVELMRASHSQLHPYSTLILAYGWGYAGMMLSPVHLCLITTKEYFGASLFDIYRTIRGPVLTLILYALTAHLFLRQIGL
jgi:integral membrane protein (TIGR00529 family)